jgi:hypothetical protein
MLKGHVPFNRSYGSIICIRFMGIISARILASTPLVKIECKGTEKFRV